MSLSKSAKPPSKSASRFSQSNPGEFFSRISPPQTPQKLLFS